MKTLYIIRHAKSSWDDTSLDDFDRPLNERGKKDAPRMGKRLKERSVTPDLMLSSPAKRALSTCRKIAEVLKYPEDKIKTEKSLYHASADGILKVIKDIKDKHEVVLGHNPGLTDFVNDFMEDDNQFIDNIPTCGIVCFKIDVDFWSSVRFGEGKFEFFDFPKAKND
jgi:phosphohistidine phosphatase